MWLIKYCENYSGTLWSTSSHPISIKTYIFSLSQPFASIYYLSKTFLANSSVFQKKTEYVPSISNYCSSPILITTQQLEIFTSLNALNMKPFSESSHTGILQQYRNSYILALSVQNKVSFCLTRKKRSNLVQSISLYGQ